MGGYKVLKVFVARFATDNKKMNIPFLRPSGLDKQRKTHNVKCLPETVTITLYTDIALSSSHTHIHPFNRSSNQLSEVGRAGIRTKEETK